MSSARWTPKASPSRAGGLLREMSASRGAVRIPLPVRSRKRKPSVGSQAAPADHRPSLLAADSA